MSERIILIVDDNELMRYVTVQQLNALGFASETAVDGKEGLEKYTSGKYCLILMDIMMPGMTGFEATVAIRRMEELSGSKRIPIVAITAYQERAACLQAGMDDYLFKPVELDELRAVLNKWLPAKEAGETPEELLNAADEEISKTRQKLDSVGDKINELRKKYGLDR